MQLKIRILLLTALVTSRAEAQLYVQSSAVFCLQQNAQLSVEGLVLMPSSDLSWSNISITRSNTPARDFDRSPESIRRVYNFSNPVLFAGLLGIRYLPTELNDIPESSLTLATRSALTLPFTRASDPTIDASANYVRATYPRPVEFIQVTAMASTIQFPVHLAHFEVVQEGTSALLRWSTTEELNSSHFEVLHSLNAQKWAILDQVASHRNSTILQEYSYLHANPARNLNYYRLRMVDQDGSAELGPVKTLELPGLRETSIYPNPVKEQLTIHSDNWDQVKEVSLVNNQGITVYRNDRKPETTVQVGNLPAGTYTLRLILSNGTDEIYKVVLVH